jgi:predicted nucleic-acid-binding protein
VELVWVLDSCFDLGRTQLAEALEAVLRTREFVVENADIVWKAARLYRTGSADFADHVIERSAAFAGCTRTMTFDQRAASAGGMTLVQ